jgi:cation diffusion facilitator CzcD-associated flavoprotein CzcO
MATAPIETDYLVIGAGAIGMAFVDTLLTDTDAQIVMVDRHHRPGGHWNEAYPFVRLHQPAAYYGVNSRELGQGMSYDRSGNRRVNDRFQSATSDRAYRLSGRSTWGSAVRR